MESVRVSCYICKLFRSPARIAHPLKRPTLVGVYILYVVCLCLLLHLQAVSPPHQRCIPLEKGPCLVRWGLASLQASRPSCARNSNAGGGAHHGCPPGTKPPRGVERMRGHVGTTPSQTQGCTTRLYHHRALDRTRVKDVQLDHTGLIPSNDYIILHS